MDTVKLLDGTHMLRLRISHGTFHVWSTEKVCKDKENWFSLESQSAPPSERLLKAMEAKVCPAFTCSLPRKTCSLLGKSYLSHSYQKTCQSVEKICLSEKCRLARVKYLCPKVKHVIGSRTSNVFFLTHF